MRHIQFTLFGEGRTDRALLPILDWLIRETHKPETVAYEFLSKPDLRPDLDFAAKLQAALELAPCDVLFVHRDADNQAPQLRYDEITTAIAALSLQGTNIPHVCVIPIRMTEAWLLIDEPAIRKASGRPNNTDHLDLPKVSHIEGLPDPKDTLYQLLREASGRKGRRLRSFDVSEAASLVSESTTSFAPLRKLNAFARLEEDLRKLAL